MTDLDQDVINQFVGAAHGDFAAVKKLLFEHPELLNQQAVWGETAIQAAAQMVRSDIADFLLAQGAPLDICTAAALGRKDEVAAILSADPLAAHAVGAHGIPLMYFPAAAGREDIAELILAAGAPVNGGDGVSTPLHGAVMFDRKGMAAWLLAHGANPAATDYEGRTPLEAAQAAGKKELAALLSESAHDKE